MTKAPSRKNYHTDKRPTASKELLAPKGMLFSKESALDLNVYEVKNFAANNNHSSGWI